MHTSFRDNSISRNRLLFKLTLLWAMSSTLAVIILACVCFYVVGHQQTHWLPVCTSEDFSIGGRNCSPHYFKEMTQKVADLRLTYNPDTIESRYTMLEHLIPANHQEAFKRLLDEEKSTVLTKQISSVFYAETLRVDVEHATGVIAGVLVRTSHGLQLSPQHKTYRLQFSFHQGLLGLQSIEEIHDDTHH